MKNEAIARVIRMVKEESYCGHRKRYSDSGRFRLRTRRWSESTGIRRENQRSFGKEGIQISPLDEFVK